MRRRPFCSQLLAALAGLSAERARAESFPGKPVTIVVAYTPGGANDVTARVYGDALAARFRQAFMVENRAGAGGITGTAFVARSKPDGHTLLMAGGGPMTINPALYGNLPYDPIKDFSPIALVSRLPLMMVVPAALPVASVAQFIDHARRPEGVTFASPGVGTVPHLAAELFMRQAGVTSIHIPHKGSVPAITDLLAGRVDMMFNGLNTSLPYIRSGKLKALAITTPERARELPDIPTLQEVGVKDFDVSVWFGFFAPAKTPPDIVQLIASELQRAAQLPELQQQLSAVGFEAVASTPEKLGQLLQQESQRWREVVRRAGIKVE